MKVSRRELMLGLSTGAVALFGLTAVLAGSRIDRWKEARAEQQSVIESIEQDKKRVEERPKWETQYQELNKSVPPFAADQKMDVYWLSMMDSLASKRGVVISKRQVGKETKIGELYEVPIECQECEGSLDAVVGFLFDLQVQGGMLDIRQLMLMPKSGNMLRGKFTLYCAYTREAPVK